MARFPKSSTPKLTKKLIEELESILRTGVYLETAVAMVGISKDTYYRWLREAQKEDSNPLTKELSDAVRQSIAISEARDLAFINAFAHGLPAVYEHEPVLNPDGSVFLDKEGNPLMRIVKDAKGNPILLHAEIKADWKAAAWRLQRRHPNRWGNRVSINFNDYLNEFCNENLPKLSDSNLDGDNFLPELCNKIIDEISNEENGNAGSVFQNANEDLLREFEFMDEITNNFE